MCNIQEVTSANSVYLACPVASENGTGVGPEDRTGRLCGEMLNCTGRILANFAPFCGFISFKMAKGMKIFSHSRTSGQDYTLYALVFLVAMGARIFFLVWIDEPILFFKYPYFADKLAGGKDIGDRIVDLSPFYLYFLTLLKKIFGLDWVFVKFIQSFLGALNSLLILALGNRVFGKTAGLIAALMFALYGNVIVLESLKIFIPFAILKEMKP